jgi:hypothetical protein
MKGLEEEAQVSGMAYLIPESIALEMLAAFGHCHASSMLPSRRCSEAYFIEL